MEQTPYYVFNADEFTNNYKELEDTFRAYYPKYQIAYSFKTNYTPAVCKTVLSLGGFAEVVSDMEYELAKRVGFPISRIIYNGPGKGSFFKECVLEGGLLNIDSFYEVDKACKISINHPGLSVGMRVNFDVGNGLISRFGLDAYNGDLEIALSKLNKSGILIKGLHFHISRARGIEAWKTRISKLLEIADRVEEEQKIQLDYIDIGSGMFGKIDEVLKEQFTDVPSYQDYALVVAGEMANHYSERTSKPVLFTEPGTTIVSKYFDLYSTVLDLKNIRGKRFALLDCSFHNVGEICSLKKVPMSIWQDGGNEKEFDKIDLVGYTCLEQDVIYSDYEGRIGKGDIVRFRNVGGYSIVSKPPFIHPDIPIYMDANGKRTCVKREQTIDDIFSPFFF